MKLAKLSLAAIMAAGAFSVANATPLEDAIKGVDLSGFVRFRWYDESEGTNTQTDRNRFSSELLFKAPAGDNLSVGVSVSYESSQYAADQASSDANIVMHQAWLKYATADYSVKIGRQIPTTPWTETGYNGSMGNGVIGMYTGVENWTFAGAFFSQTDGANATIGTLADGENISAAAVIGQVGPVNLQVWGANMTNIFDSSIYAQADMKMAGFDVKVQMNQMNLADETAGLFADDSGLFWGAEASYSMDNFTVGGGYSSTDDDMPIYTLDPDDSGMVKWGKQIYYQTVNTPDADTYAVYGKAKFGAIGAGAGYVGASIGNNDMDEFYVDASYKYSKHFGLSTYYSVLNDDASASAADNNEFRFEAKYTF